MIVRTNRELKASYNELTAGDVFIGNLSLKYLKQPMLIDMLERGIRCLPSPLAQILNSSKVAQAFVLREWMLPHTRSIIRRADLMDAINTFDRNGGGPVVTKQDSMHCGHGIRRWETIETLYSFMALSESSYPFVLQPFVQGFTDIRVIIVGDYIEAYARSNPCNFRVNLSLGGIGSPYELDEAKAAFCRSVMQRGRFPYAHLDLMILENGKCYLSEITLNGGIKGARIGREELAEKKRALLEQLIHEPENRF
jgi:glutathione synthase/RimK-type ligase-like ATP-grasp enzyme